MEGQAPPNWNGPKGGTVSVVDEPGGRSGGGSGGGSGGNGGGEGVAVVRAAAGGHTLTPGGKGLTLRFSLLVTPVRRLRCPLGCLYPSNGCLYPTLPLAGARLPRRAGLAHVAALLPHQVRP